MSPWRILRSYCLALCCVLIVTARAAAQQTPDPLANAITAYTDLDFDLAATRLRAALTLVGPQRLNDADRARALMYLGATELYRDARPEATDAFRTLLLLNPRFRPDAVVFPPEVVAVFQETRIGVRAIEAVVASVTDLAVPVDRFPVMLYASSLHDIRVRLTTSYGAAERVLYDGVVGDSLQIAWDGRDASGRPVPAGRYLLRIVSRGPAGAAERELQLPLEVELLPADTLPHPQPPLPSTLRPETEVRANGVRQFLTGLAGAAVIVALPSIAGGSDPGAARYGVAAAVGLGGVIGLATSARPRPVPENIAYNNARRADWQRELDQVRAENDQRRSVTRIRVRAERPVSVDIR